MTSLKSLYINPNEYFTIADVMVNAIETGWKTHVLLISCKPCYRDQGTPGSTVLRWWHGTFCGLGSLAVAKEPWSMRRWSVKSTRCVLGGMNPYLWPVGGSKHSFRPACVTATVHWKRGLVKHFSPHVDRTEAVQLLSSIFYKTA